jgi:peptide chain release factor
MEAKIIQITSGRGPAECCMAVALALRELILEARELQMEYELVERSPGQETGTLNSVTLRISGKNTGAFAKSWEGVLLWIAQSPFRKFHKRKNWFIGVHVLDSAALPSWNERDIEYKTMRASGPGGQNVNKVESAVRATHLPSGVQVMVNETRSQLQNKKLAVERLKEQFIKWQLSALQNGQQEQWQHHNTLERGNPKRVYSGSAFKKEKTNGTN